MGGGGNSRDRREEDRLAAERAAQQAAANQAIVVAQKPAPLESFLSDQDLATLQWADSAGRDVRTMPGMGSGLALYDNAVKDADSERMGIGALRFGADEAGGYTNLLRENQREHRQRDAAGQLENTVNQRIAAARGEAMPLINIQQDRNMGIAGMRTGMYESAADRSQQFRMRPKQPSFWQGLLQTGVQAAGTKAMMGCVVLDTRILTPTGFRPISELAEGDLAVGVNPSGDKLDLPIVRKRVTDESEILRITMNGKSLECSPSHRLMISYGDHSETPASDLKAGQYIVGGKIEAIERLTEKKPVAIIKLGTNSQNFGFVDEAGFLSLDDYAVRAATCQ